MLQSIVGPPLKGPTDLKSPAGDKAQKDFKGSGSDSEFGKTLDNRISKVSKEPKESSRSSEKDSDLKSEVNESPPKAPRRTQTGDVEKRSWQRQQAIKEFMDSIESEFQIPPTRLVEAMAKLDDTQLLQAPEESAEVFIDQLGLNPDDAEKAQALYVGLLTQLQNISQPQEKNSEAKIAVGMGLGAGAYLGMQERLAAQQERQEILNASLSRMTQNFWKTPDSDVQNGEAPLDSKMEATGVEGPLSQTEIPKEAAIKELPPHLKGQMTEVASPGLLAALAAQKAQSKGSVESSENLEIEGTQLKKDFELTAETMQSESGPPSVSPNLNKVSAKNAAAESDLFSGQKDFLGPQPPEMPSNGAKEISNSLENLESKLRALKDSLSGSEQGATVAPDAVKLENAFAPPVAVAGVGAAASTGLSEADQQAAVQQVLKQAQFLVNKGGGEMNVQMSPEGMGTIHLKVLLQDGKVQVQMQAETQEAKNTIESSLAELKTSLAAQKLSMDNVKVDVVGQTSADTSTQNQTQSNGQGQRDQTRQFWNQFNENFGSQGRRESLMEMPSLKGYGSKRDPLQPIEASSDRPENRKVEGKGRGLNLVA